MSAETESLKYITYLEHQSTSRLNYARRLVKKRSRSTFLRDYQDHCNFVGYVLAAVIARDLNKHHPPEYAVYIQDADDWGMELVVDTLKEAEEIFDRLFGDSPDFDGALERKLRHEGFKDI